MESLPQEARMIDISQPGKAMFTPPPISISPEKRVQFRDSISWLICFAIVAGITGALLIYKIGVTMSNVTSILFYFSLAGLVFFTVKAILLFRSRDGISHTKSPQLN